MDDFDIIEVKDGVLYGRCFLTGEFIQIFLGGVNDESILFWTVECRLSDG